MSGFDQNRVYSVQVLAGEASNDQPSQIEQQFYTFLSEFRVGNVFTYRDRLKASLLLHHHTLEVDLRDMVLANPELAQRVQSTPGEMIPLVRYVRPLLDRNMSCEPGCETRQMTNGVARSCAFTTCSAELTSHGKGTREQLLRS